MYTLMLMAVLLLQAGVNAPPQANGSGSPPDDSSPRALAQYVLGPHDEISLWSIEVEELTGKTLQVDTAGFINVPLAGRLRAAGLTPQELETELAKRLAPYILRPDVSVSVSEFGSQPVSVIGAVNNPGLHQLKGQRTLVEVLAIAGGVRPEAGHSIKITRRVEHGRIPLPNATDSPDGTFTTAEVSLREVLEAHNPNENVPVRPHDIISIPPAQMVYVVGEVSRPGGFPLNDRESLSVLQALSLAGGLSRTAAANDARILRASATGAPRDEVGVRVRQILSGKSEDVPLRAQDILFVPSSKSKALASRAVEMAVQTLSGVLIWQAAR